MASNNQIDLGLALRKLHELALADGDLGYEYWYQVAQLLKRAAGMQAEIDALSRELEKFRANHDRPDRRSFKEALGDMPDVGTDDDFSGRCS
jgi:hypothetical protein